MVTLVAVGDTEFSGMYFGRYEKIGQEKLGPELVNARLVDQVRGYARANNSELILEWMEDADIALLAFENTMAKTKDYYHPTPSYYWFRSDPSAAEDLKLLGIDVVSMANNIVFSYGDEGFTDTTEALDRAGIKHFGAGMNLKEAQTPAILEEKGEKIGFLGFATAFGRAAAAEDRAGVAAIRSNLIYEFGRGVRRLPTSYQPFYSILPTIKEVPLEEDVQMMRDCIKDLRKKVGFVVVTVHGQPHIPPMRDFGPELKYQGFDPTPTDSQRALYHTIIDAGADLVIGGGVHSAQGIEIYKDKYIFYSLGDYFMQIEADIARNIMNMQITLMIKINIENKKASRVEILPTMIDEPGLPILSKDYENVIKVLGKVSAPLNARVIPYQQGAIVEPIM